MPNQMFHDSVGRGSVLNILCIGETGLGKSTLMNSLFNKDFESIPSTQNVQNVTLNEYTHDVQESNVQLKLTFVETVGYGEQLNVEDNFKPVADYIDKQFELYFQAQLNVEPTLSTYRDTRVHACLYFISPTGHGLKCLDVLCMKKLDTMVNLIPIIAKADAISKSELQNLKTTIRAELCANGVKIYQFLFEDKTKADCTINSHIPVALIGGADYDEFANKMVRGRRYPQRTLQIENESHYDFDKLKKILIGTNMKDLLEKTHKKHYEPYNIMRLNQIVIGNTHNEIKLSIFKGTFEEERIHNSKEIQNNEDEIKQNLVRAKERITVVRESDKKLRFALNQLQEYADEDKKKLQEFFLKISNLQRRMYEDREEKQDNQLTTLDLKIKSLEDNLMVLHKRSH